MQAGEAPVGYQVAFQHMERRLASLEDQSRIKDQQITRLNTTNAVKDAEIVVYQLVNRGVKALHTDRGTPDPTKINALVQRLAALPPKERQGYVNEIELYWAKDASLTYAARGAPIGGFVQTPMLETPADANPDPNACTQYELDAAQDHMQKTKSYDFTAALVEVRKSGKVPFGQNSKRLARVQ